MFRQLTDETFELDCRPSLHHLASNEPIESRRLNERLCIEHERIGIDEWNCAKVEFGRQSERLND